MTRPQVRRPRGARSTVRAVAIPVLASVLLLAGCGTRMSADRIEAADGSARGGALGATDSAVAGDLPIAKAPPTEAGSANDPIATAGPALTPGPAKVNANAKPGGTGSTQKNAPAGGAPVAPRAGSSAPCARTLEPVVLGQTAPFSGIIGASIGNLRSGLALWVRAVNARGGIQCHPVQMFQMDDGADPARVSTNLTELTRKKKAVAIVGIGIPTTFSAARQFAEKNKIPFIGGDLNEPAWFASPWLFPQGGSPLAALAGAMKEAAKSINATKAGLIYCVEAASCGIINDNFEAMAKQANLQVVLRKVTSITAPDYTAECQALKAAGAEVAFFGLESSGDSRAARSCRTLGYTPPVATGALAVSDAAAKDKNLQELGVFLGTGNAPFTATDTPGAREFQQAYRGFSQGAPIDQNSIVAWSAGKLFEAALAKVFTAARSGPITTQLVLDGLWQIKNETLDGLAPGLTFTRDAPPKRNDCYYSLTINTAGYGKNAKSSLTCFRGLPQGF